jgi:hypothetical protein
VSSCDFNEKPETMIGQKLTSADLSLALTVQVLELLSTAANE